MGRISDKQKKILDGLGVEYNDKMSGYYAYKLIERTNAERKAQRAENRKVATDSQKKFMDELGIEYDDMTTTYQAWTAINETTKQLTELVNTIDSASNTTLYDLASNDVEWAVDTPAHAKGPCPFCSGNDFWVNKQYNVGGCSQCSWYEQDKNGAGAIGYYCAKNDVKWYKAAVAIDSDVVIQHAATTTVKEPQITGEEFRAKWLPKLVQGQRAFANSKSSRYLESRGIRVDVAMWFGVGASASVGYGAYRNDECLLFPYYNEFCELSAINRRVSKKVRKDKCRFIAGSAKKNALFTTIEQHNDDDMVWVVEGEINVISVWQELNDLGLSCSVYSVSSEGDLRSRAFEMKERFGNNLIIWCDKPAIAEHARNCGVVAWATKRDANDLLIANELESCIYWMLDRFKPIVQDIKTIEDAIDYNNIPLAQKMLSQITDDAERCKMSKIVNKAKKEYNSKLNERLRNERSASNEMTKERMSEKMCAMLNEVGYLADQLSGEARAQAAKLYIELEQAYMDGAIDKARSTHAEAKSLVTEDAWQELKKMIEQEERVAQTVS